MSDIPPWTGVEQLVVGLDVGSTQSGASIVHCIPNQVPKPRVVMRLPSSPNSAKIPTIICYDHLGIPRSFGAEALEDGPLAKVEDGEWFLCRWFKLKLHPVNMALPKFEALIPPPPPSPDQDEIGRVRVKKEEEEEEGEVDQGPVAFEVPNLPNHVNIRQAYRDMLNYLFVNAKDFFENNQTDGESIWRKLSADLVLVIAQPNSWSLVEQTVLRNAVKDAGFLGGREEERVHFLTESEASVHFGLAHATSQHVGWLKADTSFVVVDAGGSTVDTCVYKARSVTPKLTLEEVKTSDSTQSGAIFVSRAFEAFIKNKLKYSRFGTPEFIKVIVEGFDTKTKIAFDKIEETYIIRFGYDRDTDRAVGIVRGRLSLSGAEIKSCFDPCVNRIMESVKSQIGNTPVSKILVVGGFGESPYLRRRLREAFESPNCKLVTVDMPSTKAVAEGLCLHHVKNTVVARATRFEYGIEVIRLYVTFPHEITQRPLIYLFDGTPCFNGGWSTIVKQGVVVEADFVYRKSFVTSFDLLNSPSWGYSVKLMTYNGQDGERDYGGWFMDPSGVPHHGFVSCCTIKANLKDLAARTPSSISSSGKHYKTLQFEVGLLTGGTSLRACLIWKEGNREVRGPATIIPPTFV